MQCSRDTLKFKSVFEDSYILRVTVMFQILFDMESTMAGHARPDQTTMEARPGQAKPGQCIIEVL